VKFVLLCRFLCSVLSALVCPSSFGQCILCHSANVFSVIRPMYSLSFGQCILCHSANVFSVIRSMYSLSFGQCILCHSVNVFSVIRITPLVCPFSFGQCILCHSDYPFFIFKLFLLCIVMSDRSRNDIDLTK
jgi:hypothetical protein